MSLLNFSISAGNWSLAWALGFFVVIFHYILFFNPSKKQILNFFFGLLICYVIVGSPLTKLTQFGLHSVHMVQQVLVFIVIPVFFWASFSSKKIKHSKKNKHSKAFLISCWIIGVVAMWTAHFLTAAKLSAKTGLAICGLQVSEESIWVHFSDNILLLVLLICGMLFYAPIFGTKESLQLKPLEKVIYLFAACVSCSILGLWVAFSAANAPIGEAAGFLTVLRNPLPMSIRTDQELAGMIMWVPGCILYVAISSIIAIQWLEGKSETKIYEQKFIASRYQKE